MQDGSIDFHGTPIVDNFGAVIGGLADLTDIRCARINGSPYEPWRPRSRSCERGLRAGITCDVACAVLPSVGA
jgi:hypothetical protein